MSDTAPSARADASASPSSRTRLFVEAVGLAGVIVSLVFVGFEIRQNTTATRSAVQQAVFEGGIEANVNVMANQRLRELMVLTETDPDWIASAPRDADYLLLERFYLNRFNNLENAYYHYLQGTYDPGLWEGQEGWIAIIAGEAPLRHFWSELGEAFFPEFQAYMDSVMASVPPPAELVSVGSHRLEVRGVGEGGPTVVFDAGFSGGMDAWWPAQRLAAERTTTLAYERAGLGGSDVGPEPRTAGRIARELHELVRVTGVPKPLILVGHSAGGMFVPLYASMYPEEVAGLVLVDPATADIYQNMRDNDPVRWEAFADEVRSPHPGWGPQWEALPTSLEEVRAAWPPPDVPTVVLTGLTLLPGEWALGTREYMDYWAASHRRLTAGLGDAEHIVLPGADHLTILEEPVLPRKILELVEGARADGGSPP